MGAVRRLATVVVIGLVALSTVMVVYLAAEPNRRSSETTEQDVTSIERGTDLYITYCLQCHGPAGLGALGKDGRIGAVLNQNAVYSEDQMKEMLAAKPPQLNAIFQSDDPVQQGIAEDWLRYRITYGIPAEPTVSAKVMPAFGHDLNIEEMNEIVYLVMHGDWNYVYNTAVSRAGVAEANAACLEDKTGEYCGDTSQAPPIYPEVPKTGPPKDASTPEASAASGDATGSTDSQAAASIEAFDIGYDKDQLTVKPGDTITFTNTGALEHDFVVDDLKISEAAEAGGTPVTITIPEDAAPGDYEFYCSVPGHKAAGMVGTLTIEAP